jgi:hypothetical protein
MGTRAEVLHTQIAQRGSPVHAAVSRPPDSSPHVPTAPVLRPVCVRSCRSTANSIPDHPAWSSPPTSPNPRPASGPFAWPSSAHPQDAESARPDGPPAAPTPSALAGSRGGKCPLLATPRRCRRGPKPYIQPPPEAVAIFRPTPSPTRRNAAELRRDHPRLQDSSKHNWMEMLFLNRALVRLGLLEHPRLAILSHPVPREIAAIHRHVYSRR